ncbi:MAG: hypothetical protein LBJ00_11715 [Planctomycetaceae bacterium]|jgi:hypothetical protein|nr:hypothetical protein [Planctomycetaceae bacterium]
MTTGELPFTVNPRSEVEFDVSLHADSDMIGKQGMRQILLNLNTNQPAVGLIVNLMWWKRESLLMLGRVCFCVLGQKFFEKEI